MNLKSQNNQLICTPFKERHVTTKKVGSLDILNSTVSLTPLTVLVDGDIIVDHMCQETFYVGSVVYVRADRYATEWGKRKCECEDLKDKEGKPVQFIVVPGNEVVMVRTVDQPSTAGRMQSDYE